VATSAHTNRVLYTTASATTTIQSFNASQFARARAADGTGVVTGYPMTGTLTAIAAHGGGTNYSVQRTVVWLTTPELFGDIDGEVIIRLWGSGSAGVTIVKCDLTASETITATDGVDGYAPYIWDSIKPDVLFSTEVSSSLTSSAYTDIILNSEAKRWILSGSEWSREILGHTEGYGFALGIIDYANDYLNVEPTSAEGAFIETTGTLATQGPSTTVDGVWLAGSRGAEPTYTKDDYVIIPYDNDITRYPRRIPQTPYGFSIKGPISLRKKNVPYKVTT
jgi:hypothetical protein